MDCAKRSGYNLSAIDVDRVDRKSGDGGADAQAGLMLDGRINAHFPANERHRQFSRNVPPVVGTACSSPAPIISLEKHHDRYQFVSDCDVG